MVKGLLLMILRPEKKRNRVEGLNGHGGEKKEIS